MFNFTQSFDRKKRELIDMFNSNYLLEKCLNLISIFRSNIELNDLGLKLLLKFNLTIIDKLDEGECG